MPNHRYSRIPVDSKNWYTHPSLCSRLTYSWVKRALSAPEVALAPGQSSAWWSSRNVRVAWMTNARAACIHEDEPCLWKALLVQVQLVNFLRLFLVLGLIGTVRILQVAFFGMLFNVQPYLLYESSAPWISFSAAGFWFSVFLEAFARGHFSYFAQAISSSMKSGLTGLVYDKVLQLKDSDLADFTRSHMMNLVSKDLEPLDRCAYVAHFLLLAPFELLICSLFLSFTTGWEGVVGIAYMMLCTALRFSVGKVYRKLSLGTTFFTDQRLSLLAEIISGIQPVKMNAWEDTFENLIQKVRRKELSYIKRKTFVLGALSAIEQTVPIISTLISLTVLVLRGKQLTSQNVFIIFLIMNILHSSCNDGFVSAVEILVKTLARLKRVQRFLLTDYPTQAFFKARVPLERSNSEETRTDSHSGPKSRDYFPPWVPRPRTASVSLYGVCCEREYGLAEIELLFVNLHCVGNELVALTGPPKAGAGTSLLFDAVMEEVPPLRGQVHRSGKVAYVAKKPWIFSGTIRDNILFGESYQVEKFVTVIKSCKLESLLKILPDRDLTVIGEHGVQLKVNHLECVSLARAAYSNATIILLDTPLHHVHTALANQIFDECIRSLLGKRLRLLITRHGEFLEKSDRVVLMEDGAILREGTFSKHLDAGEDFSWVTSAGHQQHEHQDEVDEADPARMGSAFQDKDDGRVGVRHYYRYLKQAGYPLLLLLIGVPLIIAPGGALAVLGFSLAEVLHVPGDLLGPKQQQRERMLQFVSALVGLFLILLFVRAFFLLACGLCCSTHLHKRSVSSLLKAPINVFEATSKDQLLGAFSGDLKSADEKFPPVIQRFLRFVVDSLVASAVIKVAAPWTGLAFLPAVLSTIWIGNYYFNYARKARCLEVTIWNPLLAHLSDSIKGVVTIRAYQKQMHVLRELYSLQNQHDAAELMRLAAEQWLSVRHVAVMSVFMFFVTVIAIFTSNAALAAMLLVFDRQLVIGFSLVPSLFNEIEQFMCSAARLLSFLDLQPERGYENSTKPPENWPSEGAVCITDTSLADTAHKRASFQTMTLNISAGEKICITGKIGSGKSSLVSVLLRLTSAEPSGVVVIDDVPLNTLNPQGARRAFSVLQKEPFVFSASLRQNLDPEGIHKDEELWNALEVVRMATDVHGLTDQLDYLIMQPFPFTKGQLQLLCLARALLQKRKILVFDRVLSNVDFNTFRKIQDAMVHELSGCTVITIPNGVTSIDIILSHERVVILEEGEIVETGSPRDLLEQHDSKLSLLLHYYRDRSSSSIS